MAIQEKDTVVSTGFGGRMLQLLPLENNIHSIVF